MPHLASALPRMFAPCSDDDAAPGRARAHARRHGAASQRRGLPLASGSPHVLPAAFIIIVAPSKLSARTIAVARTCSCRCGRGLSRTQEGPRGDAAQLDGGRARGRA